MNFFDRLSDYDIFAYLPQGFFILTAVDYIFGTAFILNANLNVTQGVLLIFAAYVAGHIVASPSSFLLERRVVAKHLGRPSINLLSDKRPQGLRNIVFSDYYTPLAPSLRSEVLRKLGLIDIRGQQGEDIFWMAYPVALKNEYARGRMETFLNLYGFCRNVSFIFGLASLLLVAQIVWTTIVDHYYLDSERVWAAIVLGAAAFIMFLRYLKFFRLYSVEVFRAFAS